MFKLPTLTALRVLGRNKIKCAFVAVHVGFCVFHISHAVSAAAGPEDLCPPVAPTNVHAASPAQSVALLVKP